MLGISSAGRLCEIGFVLHSGPPDAGRAAANWLRLARQPPPDWLCFAQPTPWVRPSASPNWVRFTLSSPPGPSRTPELALFVRRGSPWKVQSGKFEDSTISFSCLTLETSNLKLLPIGFVCTSIFELTTDYRLPAAAIWLCFARIFTNEAQGACPRVEPAPDLSGGGGTRSRSRAISRRELGILSVISVSLWGRGDACVARTVASRRWTKSGASLVKPDSQSP